MNKIKNRNQLILPIIILIVLLLFRIISLSPIANFLSDYIRMRTETIAIVFSVINLILDIVFYASIFIGIKKEKHIIYLIISALNTIGVCEFRISSIVKSVTFSHETAQRIDFPFLGADLIVIVFSIIMLIVTVAVFKQAGGKANTTETVQIINTEKNINEELFQYKELLEIGAITQEEFDAKKKELLGL